MLNCDAGCFQSFFSHFWYKKVCPKERKSVAFYASQQCKEWGKLMSQNGKSKVELLPEGKQVKHQPVKGSWISCAIFCKVIFINYIPIVPQQL